ncbi:hypothetical protein JL722_8104 [Aureococcus anophagefferens]|nr:hypothetical protein JL722_8104 [Aureococcus anophagefferens]
MDGDVADLAAWRRRVDGELASLRQSRDDARRARRARRGRAAVAEAPLRRRGRRRLRRRRVQSAQLQAHAAVSAAIAPVQAHLERELSVVRRHVAALRSGGSFENVLPGDVEDALAADRPSELLVKGVVASACADVEATLEKKLTTVLSARVALDLEAKAKDVQRDAEDRVFARVRAAATRTGARAGLLACLGEGEVGEGGGPFGQAAADAAAARTATVDAAVAATREHAARLAELRDDLEKARADARTERDQRSAAVDAARADLTKQAVAAMARATEARDAVASCQSFVDAAEAAARARGDRERSEVLQKVAVYADEARVDVGELRRRQAASESALGALEEKLHLLLKLETRLGNVLEVKIAEQASDGDGRDRRLARLEAWRDEHGGGGAEGAIKKLGDADETARKVSRDVARRVSALEEQLEPLQRHARDAPASRLALRRDVADAAARADALAKNVDEQALAHRAAADHGELRATVSRHHGDLSTSSQLAFERSARRAFQRDATNDLEAVRAVAKGALGRTERVLVELDAVARRVDDLAADVKTSATLAARGGRAARRRWRWRRRPRDDADADESKPVVRVVLARERAGGVATSPTASGGATSPSLSKTPSPSKTPSRRSDSDEDLDDVEDVPLDAAPAPAPEKPLDPVVVRMRSPSPKALPSPASSTSSRGRRSPLAPLDGASPKAFPSTKKRSPVASLGLPSPAPSSDWDASLPASPAAPADRGPPAPRRARRRSSAAGASPESIREEEGGDDDEAPAKAFLTAQPTPTSPSSKSSAASEPRAAPRPRATTATTYAGDPDARRRRSDKSEDSDSDGPAPPSPARPARRVRSLADDGPASPAADIPEIPEMEDTLDALLGATASPSPPRAAPSARSFAPPPRRARGDGSVDESSDDGDGGGEPTMTLSFGGGGDSSGDETPPEAAPAAAP